MSGRDATSVGTAGPGRLLHGQGYDLYRFDREWIRDWPGDATELADAVRQAKAMGYRRVILAGQSAGAWVSMAAAIARRAGRRRDLGFRRPSRRSQEHARRRQWHVRNGSRSCAASSPGPRLVVVNFAGETMTWAAAWMTRVQPSRPRACRRMVISDPPGFKGHGAATDGAFGAQIRRLHQRFHRTGRAPGAVPHEASRRHRRLAQSLRSRGLDQVASRADDVPRLQHVQRDGDARAAHRHQPGQRLMGQRELAIAEPERRHRGAPRQPLLDRGAAHRHRVVRNLDQESVHGRALSARSPGRSSSNGVRSPAATRRPCRRRGPRSPVRGCALAQDRGLRSRPRAQPTRPR